MISIFKNLMYKGEEENLKSCCVLVFSERDCFHYTTLMLIRGPQGKYQRTVNFADYKYALKLPGFLKMHIRYKPGIHQALALRLVSHIDK
jgi:hypothetical protein